MGGKPQRVGTIFYWGSWPLETLCKDFHLAIGGGLDWMNWLKNGVEKDFIFHAIFPVLYISFLVKILLAKLKNFYIQYSWISIMKNQNSNQNVKVEKMVVFVKTWLLPSQVIVQLWHLAQLCITQRRSKICINHVTHHLSSADSIFSPKISKFCYTKKYRYSLHLNT